MHRTVRGFLFPWLALVAASSSAQLPTDFTRRMGLETAWRSQLRLPVDGGGIVSVDFWVDKKTVRQYAVVELADRTIRVASDQLDADGQLIGMEKAKEMAQAQAARVLGKTEGIQVVEVSVPQIKMVVVTRDGLVQTLDAETGKLLWASPCGPSWAPAHPGAVCEAGVVVIHGDNLHLLDWETGKHLMIRKLQRATSNSVAAYKDIAFVSDFTGRIEAFALGREMRPWAYVMQGRAVGQPVTLLDKGFCAISTNVGFVYVYKPTEPPEVWLRFESGAPISGSLAVGNGAFYSGNVQGTITKFSADERFGTILWELRTGYTITAPALVVGNSVFVVNESGDVLAVDDATGNAAWETEAVEAVMPIAVADGKLFCTSVSNQLLALDAETGAEVGRSQPLDLVDPVINCISDRVYTIMRDGRIACLRPAQAVLPTLVEPVELAPAEEQAPLDTRQPGAQPAGPAANPFGGGTPAADPFGTGAPAGDPFSTGGDGGMADPFGAGGNNDPFGSDPFGSGN